MLPQNPDCSILMPRRACPEVPNHPTASFADQLHVGAWVAKKHVGRGPGFWRGTPAGRGSVLLFRVRFKAPTGRNYRIHVSYVQGLGHVRHCLALAASNCSEFVRVTSASGMFPMSSLLLLQCGHAQITGSRYPGRLSCLYPLHSPRTGANLVMTMTGRGCPS